MTCVARHNDHQYGVWNDRTFHYAALPRPVAQSLLQPRHQICNASHVSGSLIRCSFAANRRVLLSGKRLDKSKVQLAASTSGRACCTSLLHNAATFGILKDRLMGSVVPRYLPFLELAVVDGTDATKLLKKVRVMQKIVTTSRMLKFTKHVGSS